MRILASPILDRFGRQVARPIPPVWFADAVELWARSWGRSANTRWEGAVGCFVSHLSRRESDPVLASVQSGKRAEASEPFYWHEWKQGVRPHPILGPSVMVSGYVPLDIEQLGESGVMERLNKSNMWGRGDYRNLDEAADAVTSANDRRMEAQRRKLRDGLEGPLRATIRHARGLATVSVPDQLTP